MPKWEKIVMLGLKVSGRIRKNEQFKLDEFVYRVEHTEVPGVARSWILPELSFWDRLKPWKVQEVLMEAYSSGNRDGYLIGIAKVRKFMNQTIDKDTFGKKKRRK